MQATYNNSEQSKKRNWSSLAGIRFLFLHWNLFPAILYSEDTFCNIFRIQIHLSERFLISIMKEDKICNNRSLLMANKTYKSSLLYPETNARNNSVLFSWLIHWKYATTSTSTTPTSHLDVQNNSCYCMYV